MGLKQLICHPIRGQVTLVDLGGVPSARPPPPPAKGPGPFVMTYKILET